MRLVGYCQHGGVSWPARWYPMNCGRPSSHFCPLYKARPGKCGRPPVDDRACLTGIIFVLQSGIPWWMLPQEMGCGSGVTCWRRLRDCRLTRRLEETTARLLLDRLGREGLLDWSKAVVDSQSFALFLGDTHLA